ncbi:hypothetical protein LBWT_X0920 (plasmid) [Leptolyngbya boryana IAM M-101]|nr:hypothetical protein LBWT_X0920 [Leptolyngbya boryana IAM M-101]BAS66368.1 hypothetical protein LBDG_X0920 [Leptolyngbya boryana dg5]
MSVLLLEVRKLIFDITFCYNAPLDFKNGIEVQLSYDRI